MKGGLYVIASHSSEPPSRHPASERPRQRQGWRSERALLLAQAWALGLVSATVGARWKDDVPHSLVSQSFLKSPYFQW